MAKRKLSKNQTRRIRENQRASIERAGHPSRDIIDDNLLGVEMPGRVVAHFGTQVDVETPEGLRRRCFLRANLASVVTGDHIVWRDGPDTGVVVSCETRHSLLARPDAYGKLRPVAANVDQIIVTVAPQPELHTNLIDRYIVVAECTGITPVILLNKTDLIDDDNNASIAAIVERYRQLDYTVLTTSAKHAANLQQLAAQLRDKTSIFVGQSGVGKSSLIKRLAPEYEIAIGQLSEAKTKGRHTTTHSQLFHFREGGECIDSPGIREFGLWHLSREDVIRGFKEIDRAAMLCKFRDCRHDHEPGCAVQLGLKEQRISHDRFDNCQRILASLDEVSMRRDILDND